VSADGNTAIVGGYNDNNLAGAAWVFTRTGDVWSEQGSKLVGSGAVGPAQQGISVALSADGNTALVGGFADNNSAGAAWVFTRSNGVWSQQGNKLVGSDGTASSEQGLSVALSADGNTALIGYPSGTPTGAAWIFARSSGVWTQQSKLSPNVNRSAYYSFCCVALSADGTTALLGGLTGDVFSLVPTGWVFTHSGNTWIQQGGELIASDAILPTGNQSALPPVALSADGNTALLGWLADNQFLGAAWVFTRSGGTWSQQAKLVGSGWIADRYGFVYQGYSVALSGDGNTALVGGPDDSGDEGAVWVFRRAGNVWNQSGGKLVGLGPNIQGVSVALSTDGYTALSGAGGSGAFVFAAPVPAPLGVISLWANTEVPLGKSVKLVVTLAKPAPPAGLTVDLTSSDPSKVTVTPSVFIPGGRTSPTVEPQVNGLNLGTVSIHATALGYTPDTQSVHVTASLAFARCCVTVISATPLSAVLTLSSPAPSGGLTVNLASDNPTVAKVPATIIFPAGTTSVNVPITGVAAGATLVHASSPPDLADVSVKVAVR
jgi:hypothetical protein